MYHTCILEREVEEIVSFGQRVRTEWSLQICGNGGGNGWQESEALSRAVVVLMVKIRGGGFKEKVTLRKSGGGGASENSGHMVNISDSKINSPFSFFAITKTTLGHGLGKKSYIYEYNIRDEIVLSIEHPIMPTKHLVYFEKQTLYCLKLFFEAWKSEGKNKTKELRVSKYLFKVFQAPPSRRS